MARSSGMLCGGRPDAHQNSTQITLSYDYTDIPNEECQHSIYMGMHMALLKKFIGQAHVNMRRRGRTATVHLGFGGGPVAHRMHELLCILRQEYEILIPEGLDQAVQDAARALMVRTGAVIYVENGRARVNGGQKAVDSGRTALIELVLGLLDRGCVPVQLQSRIAEDARGGGAGTNIEMDAIRYYFMRFLYKEELEDILVSTDVWLSEDAPAPSDDCAVGGSTVALCISGADRQKTEEAANRIMNVYNKVALVRSRLENSDFGDGMVKNAMVIRNQEESVVVGPVEAIRPIVACWSHCTTSMLVDAETGEFLCGKKYGKTNRIERTSGCRLAIGREAEGMRFTASGAGVSVLGYIEMLGGEFPVTSSFYVNTKHHRRIIGIRGRTIQAVMKKYNVYIQFNNINDTKSPARMRGDVPGQASGGAHGPAEDARACGVPMKNNVIMKAPVKNYENFEKIKREVLGMAGLKSPEGDVVKISLFQPGWQEGYGPRYNYMHARLAGGRHSRAAPEDCPRLDGPVGAGEVVHLVDSKRVKGSECRSLEAFPSLYNLFVVANQRYNNDS